MYLFGDEQHDAFKQLVAVEGSDGEVEEQTVENRARNELELLNEQHRQTDQHMGQDSSDTRLAYTDDPSTHPVRNTPISAIVQVCQ